MGRLSALFLVLGTLAAGALPSPARAEEPTPAQRIQKAREAMDNLEYEVASDELMIALGMPECTEAEKLEANLLAGVANRVLERNVEARLNFHYVLTRAPETRLADDTPPKIRSFFELVRQEVESSRLPPPGAAASPGPGGPAASTTPAGGQGAPAADPATEAPDGPKEADDGGPSEEPAVLPLALLIGGGTFLAAGGLGMIGGLLALGGAEAVLATKLGSYDDRVALQWVGRVGAGVGALATVVVVLGGSLLATGWVVE